MGKTDSYNILLTQKPFDGEYVRKRGANILYDTHEKVLGSISRKCIFDLNGEELAVFQREEKGEDENGKKQKSYYYVPANPPEKVDIYGFDDTVTDLKAYDNVEPDELERLAIKEAEEKNVLYRFVEDKLYSSVNGGEEELIGRIAVRKRNPSHIILLCALAVFLAAVITFIALINLPFESAPVIEVRDKNGSWEAQGVIGVLDDGLKPGDSGEYKFVISNPYNVDLEYNFTIEGHCEGAEIDYFPLEFRLRMNNVLIETDQWLSVDELKFSELEIMPAADQKFTLEWRWAFEKGDDYADTIIGRDASSISLILKLTAEQGGNSL